MRRHMAGETPSSICNLAAFDLLHQKGSWLVRTGSHKAAPNLSSLQGEGTSVRRESDAGLNDLVMALQGNEMTQHDESATDSQ